MKMYCDIITKNKYHRAPCLEALTIEHPEIGEIVIDFDESDRYTDEGFKHCYRFKGVAFTSADKNGDEKTRYANGQLDIIKASKFLNIIVTDIDDNELIFNEDFTFTDNTILFDDNGNEFELKTNLKEGVLDEN